MPGSITANAFRAILERVPFRLRANLTEYFQRSDRAIERLALREEVKLEKPLALPENWLEATPA